MQVDHPKHYSGNGLEAITVIETWGLDFYLGSTLKYICRAGKKSKETEVEDLKKAAWYLNRKIERLEAAKRGAESSVEKTVDKAVEKVVPVSVTFSKDFMMLTD